MKSPVSGSSNGPDPNAAPWVARSVPWGRADLLALAAWTLLVVFFFRDVVLLKRALFYFDITEINYPYRHFFAEELKAGRFTRWAPGLYCGHPLYSESQAGYLHPFKYFFYPWLPTWQAFGLDCVLSVWLAGAGAYGWLRRHVNAIAALAGGIAFGFSGYTWAHFIHTSMLNALASVPLAFWALEVAWDRRSLRAVGLGGLALACQVFAGHLQDVILTGSALAVYATYRAATERRASGRVWAFGAMLLMGATCVLVSAVQWIPSKELIDRSPRAGGLTWDELTYGSWSPELLPTMLVRDAYGTRARDTDWMDGFYPYLEMNTYVGMIALGLAVVGLGGRRDRWGAFWPILATLGLILMLGRFTFVMDAFPYIPFVNRGRVPVRYHLWFALAISALVALGVDRLSRFDLKRVRLKPALMTVTTLLIASLLIMLFVYVSAWTERKRWPLKYHADRYAWLNAELSWAFGRSIVLAALAFAAAVWTSRQAAPARRCAGCIVLCALLAADLLATHAQDVPTIEPAYWTSTPATARWLLQQPDRQRVFGENVHASGEPGYASRPYDFMKVRELLAWSLPPVWGIMSTAGETPIIPSRRLRFTDHETVVARFDIEGLRYVLTSSPTAERRLGPGIQIGDVTIHRNPRTLPRARLVGAPVYVRSPEEASAKIKELDGAIRDRLIVEDPQKPLASDAVVDGDVTIVSDAPERVALRVDARTDAYLFLADSFDPGWTATVDGQASPVLPAYAAFRAVFVPKGQHEIMFRYEPAGFRVGMYVSLAGVLLVAGMMLFPTRMPELEPAHAVLPWPTRWPLLLVALLGVVLILSLPRIDPKSGLALQQRWRTAFHRFTWGAGIEAMGEVRPGPQSR